jgi:hypothetical protein
VRQSAALGARSLAQEPQPASDAQSEALTARIPAGSKSLARRKTRAVAGNLMTAAGAGVIRMEAGAALSRPALPVLGLVELRRPTFRSSIRRDAIWRKLELEHCRPPRKCGRPRASGRPRPRKPRAENEKRETCPKMTGTTTRQSPWRPASPSSSLPASWARASTRSSTPTGTCSPIRSSGRARCSTDS